MLVELHAHDTVCRAEDAVLATLTELALVLLYTCVLMLKSCELSPDVCATYGLGDDGRGEGASAGGSLTCVC